MASPSSGIGSSLKRASASERIWASATMPCFIRSWSMSEGWKQETTTIERRARVMATASRRSPPGAARAPKFDSTRPCGVRP